MLNTIQDFDNFLQEAGRVVDDGIVKGESKMDLRSWFRSAIQGNVFQSVYAMEEQGQNPNVRDSEFCNTGKCAFNIHASVSMIVSI